MNIGHSNSSTNDLPIAESTQIDTTSKTPLKRLRSTLALKLGLRSNPNTPVQTPSPKRNSSNPKTLSKLDPQVYLDTQSNGFASRVVKYHEASEAKTRDIANKTYRRLGDFPIVNLDKSEINLNQKQANAPQISKINIAPPINLVSASARSTIFRTGKNYGDSYPIGPSGKIGPIEGRKPIHASTSQDEPIVPPTNDYDSGTARSSLEALKEISRKRIHCDEIDGDTNKKQRNENTQNDHDQNCVQVPSTSKRSRDRLSPSYCSSSTDVQKKRYKNNDILSSLSSSILMSTPKRSSSSIETTPTKVVHLDHEHSRDANAAGASASSKPNPTESSRVGTSNSDLPLHRPTEQIKPVIKSMSDGYVPKPETSKAPKITLFNRDYSKIPSTGENKRSLDDDNEYTVSFVKPKSKASTLFSGNKNRDQKSKLEMMLSFLRGDESRDEVDSVSSSTNSVEKSKEKDSAKTTISSSSANLTTNTSVTFSTATTTSVLNAPSNAAKTNTIELPKDPIKVSNEVLKSVQSNATVTSTLITSTPLPVTVAPTSVSQSEKPQISSKIATTSVPSPTVTFNLPTAQTTTAVATSPSSNSSDSIPRLGGFAFSATPTSFTSPLAAKPTTTEIASAPKTEENKTSTPAFSFGLAKSTGSSALPSFTPPTFGANTLVKTESSTAATQSSNVQTTSASVKFSFGSPATKPPTLTTGPTISFGTPSTTTSSSITTAPNSLGTGAPSMFKFGASENTPANTSASLAPSVANTPTTSANSTSFVFGSNAPSTSAPTFGFSNTSTNVTTAAVNSSINQTTSAFSFGGAANVSKPETNAFQFGSTATNVTTSPMTFGSATATNAAPSTGLFGAVNTTNVSSTTQSAFTFGGNKPATDPKPSLFGTPPTTQSSGLGAFSTPTFGQSNNTPVFGQANSTPTFGNATSTATTTSSSNLFGNAASAQNTPIFGSNTTSAAQPKVGNAFGMTSNQNTSTPVFGSQNQSSTFGSTMNTPAFGSTSNVFGSTPTTQNQPAFGSSSSSIFSTPTTTQTNNTFGSASGVFTFGQNTSQTPATTASAGIFGTSNTNTNASAPFVFGQSNTATPTQSSGIFGAKPADNANTNTNASLTAPAAFGSTSPAFNFSAKPMFGNQPETKPQAFAFNAPNNQSANVPSFGSAPAPAAPTFGSTNGIGTSFSFNAPATNAADASKGFNFGGPASAPAATPAQFSFSAPTGNAFQFNAQQPPAANIFSIGPGSGTSTTKTGRPMRTATRRIK